VHITTKVVSSNFVRVEVYSIQHYVIKLVSYLRQVCVFLQVLRFPRLVAGLWFSSPIKLTSTI